ncbi:MAG: hypothetical protein JW850_20655 [Thermoflexales bacterium]|nr:hypothetical protein [Thermoflexales bacterium]
MRTIDNISVEEWEEIVEGFIQRMADDESFGEMPADQFFAAWAAIESAEPPPLLEIQVEVAEGQIRLMPSPAIDLTIHDNRLRLPDGRELVFMLA